MSNRILSIQSHVTHGYVGGKAAIFPLQLLGYDVINTVNFSNHSGYRQFGGTKTSADELANILKHLRENGMLNQERLLTGYIPTDTALSTISSLAAEIREKNPNLIYLLDPVMGDSGKLYVSPDVVPVYKSMLPFASIITPNWFETEILTDTKLSSTSSIRDALRILHLDYCVPNVVISSLPLTDQLYKELPESILNARIDEEMNNAEKQDYILVVASTLNPHTRSEAKADKEVKELRKGVENVSTVHALLVPTIKGYYSGVGDLFSALVLGHYHPDQSTGCPNSSDESQILLSRSVLLALYKVHTILKRTSIHSLRILSESSSFARDPSVSSTTDASAREDSEKDNGNATNDELDSRDPSRVVRRMRARELRLIQEWEVLKADENSLPAVWKKGMARWNIWDSEGRMEG